MSGCRSKPEKEAEVVPLCMPLPLPATGWLPLCVPLCVLRYVPLSVPLCVPLLARATAWLPLPGNQPLLLLPAPHAPGKPAPSFLFRDSTTTK